MQEHEVLAVNFSLRMISLFDSERRRPMKYFWLHGTNVKVDTLMSCVLQATAISSMAKACSLEN